MTIAAINEAIKSVDTNQVSDGYHTFGELYDHRITLFKAVCALQVETCSEHGYDAEVWRSKAHSDGCVWEGWFILGMNKRAGEQITYHLPNSEWDSCHFAEVLDKAPEWDGHTSADVLTRLKNQF
jgi:hypothetical protein